MRIGAATHDEVALVAAEWEGTWYSVTRAQAQFEEALGTAAPRPVLDLGDLLAGGRLQADYIAGLFRWHRAMGRLDTIRAPEPLAWRLPLRPGKVICIGRNYAAHADEFGQDVPDEPVFFNKVPDICIGPEAPIMVRPDYGRVDHEGELGVVIGRAGRDIDPVAAAHHVAGYTLVNDVTARATQKGDIAKGEPWFRAKNHDTFCPMGPVVLMKESLGWPPVTELTVAVNGEVRQHAGTDRMVFKPAQLIAYVSRYLTLRPGDVIATGTPEGVGPIEPGDTVEVRCPAIGALRNPVRVG